MSNRPKLRELAYMLGVYSQKTIPQTYINELSNYELLLTILSKINEIIERCGKYDEVINEIINYLDTLDDAVIDYLEELKDSGYIADQIKQAESKRILMVGDSYLYGANLNPPATNNFGYFMQLNGFDVTIITSPGGGFVASGDNGRFLDLINGYSGTDAESFTDVMFLGGINDTYQVLNDIRGMIRTTVSATHAKFTNARIHVGYISQNDRIDNDDKNVEHAIWVKQAYRECANSNQYCYINNSENILKQVTLLQSDGIHPTVEGQQMLANYFSQYLIYGQLSPKRMINELSIVLTDDSQATGITNNSFLQTVSNNIASLSNKQICVIAINNIGITMDGIASLIIGDFNQSLIYGGVNNFNQFGFFNIVIPAVVSYADNEHDSTSQCHCEVMPIAFRMVGKKVFIAPQALEDMGTWKHGFIRQINLLPFTFTINSDFC